MNHDEFYQHGMRIVRGATGRPRGRPRKPYDELSRTGKYMRRRRDAQLRAIEIAEAESDLVLVHQAETDRLRKRRRERVEREVAERTESDWYALADAKQLLIDQADNWPRVEREHVEREEAERTQSDWQSRYDQRLAHCWPCRQQVPTQQVVGHGHRSRRGTVTSAA